jgi:hypothetical protein
MKFYNSNDKKLNSLEMDGGGEFSKIIQFCKDNNIHYIIYNGEKNSMSIVERFNRTLRDYITRNCPNGRWIDKLNDIIHLYNNKKTSETHETPENLEHDEKKQNSYREELIGKLAKYQVDLSKFKIGDKVRIYKNNGPFEKGGGNFSKGVHEITNIKGLSIYIDNNNNKRYKVYEVMKIGENIPPPNDVVDDEMDKLTDVFFSKLSLSIFLTMLIMQPCLIIICNYIIYIIINLNTASSYHHQRCDFFYHHTSANFIGEISPSFIVYYNFFVEHLPVGDSMSLCDL